MKDTETRGKSWKSWFQRNAIQYQLPTAVILTLFLCPFFLILLLSIFSLPICYDLHPYLWGEGKIIETTQFIIFLFAGILNIFISWRAAVLSEKMIVRLFYLALGLGMFFIAGEEIAWGQQYLHFKIPGFLQTINVQNELTLHNIGILQARSDFLNLSFATNGLIGIFFTIRGKINKIKVPHPLFSWFGLIFTLAVFGIWFKIYLGDRPLNYPDEYIFHIQTETAELLIALVGFLYPWLNMRQFFSSRSLEFTRNQNANLKPPTMFPVDKRYGSITLITGILSMFWFAIIPGEEANVLFLGLSMSRLIMLVIGVIILVGLMSILIYAKKDQSWSRTTSNYLNQMVCKPSVLWSITFLSFFALIFSLILLILTYTHNEPYLIGILTRLSPWFLWLMVLSLESILLTMPKLLPLARYRLQKYKKL